MPTPPSLGPEHANLIDYLTEANRRLRTENETLLRERNAAVAHAAQQDYIVRNQCELIDRLSLSKVQP